MHISLFIAGLIGVYHASATPVDPPVDTSNVLPTAFLALPGALSGTGTLQVVNPTGGANTGSINYNLPSAGTWSMTFNGRLDSTQVHAWLGSSATQPYTMSPPAASSQDVFFVAPVVDGNGVGSIYCTWNMSPTEPNQLKCAEITSTSEYRFYRDATNQSVINFDVRSSDSSPWTNQGSLIRTAYNGVAGVSISVKTADYLATYFIGPMLYIEYKLPYNAATMLAAATASTTSMSSTSTSSTSSSSTSSSSSMTSSGSITSATPTSTSSVSGTATTTSSSPMYLMATNPSLPYGGINGGPPGMSPPPPYNGAAPSSPTTPTTSYSSGTAPYNDDEDCVPESEVSPSSSSPSPGSSGYQAGSLFSSASKKMYVSWTLFLAVAGVFVF